MYSLFAYTLGKRKVTDSLTNYIVVTNIFILKIVVELFWLIIMKVILQQEKLDAIVSPVETAPYIHTFSIGEIPSFL